MLGFKIAQRNSREVPLHVWRTLRGTIAIVAVRTNRTWNVSLSGCDPLSSNKQTVGYQIDLHRIRAGL